MTDIVMGLAGTVDVELGWDADRWSELAGGLGVGVDDLDTQVPVVDLRSLVCVVLGFLAEGAGGERYAAESAVIDDLAGRFPATRTIGGTAVRAAIAIDVLGVTSTVSIVEADPTLRAQLPESARLLAAGESAELVPHLIVQFPAGARVCLRDGEIAARHPNRVIIANDSPNEILTLAPELPAAARESRVLLLSSLNAIRQEDLLRERLQELADLVESLPPSTTVMWEDAGYHLPQFRRQVSDVMGGLVDVYSMNEDELAEIVGHPIDLLDAAEVARSVVELHARIPAPTVVVHSKYWALAAGPVARDLRPALRGGIAMASARYLAGDGMTAEDYEARTLAEPAGRAVELSRSLEALAPDLVCEPALDLVTETPTTIGLGDTFVGGFIAALAQKEGL